MQQDRQKEGLAEEGMRGDQIKQFRQVLQENVPKVHLALEPGPQRLPLLVCGDAVVLL